MAIVLKTLGVDYSKNNVGWFGRHLPDHGAALAWAGAHGAGWPMGDGYDYSLNNRPGQIVGAPVREPGFAILGLGNYIECPITDSALIADGAAGQFSMCAVVNGVPVTGTASIISTLGTSAMSGFRFGKAAGAGTLSFLADRGSETQSSVTLAGGASTAGAEFVAVVVSGLNVTLYRRGATDNALLTASGVLALSGIEGRGVGWRVGSVYSGAAPDLKIGMTGLYNRALTAAEMAEVYTAAKSRMAGIGVAI